jgi:glycosyltransferase involved in cell wall biosynthesis
MQKSKYKNDYKILVCDNGSMDGSIELYKKHKIDFIIEEKKGYGNATLAGLNHSDSKYVVMLDADLSYNEKDIPRFIEELEKGYDLINGNRFLGKIEKNAMPVSHKIGSRLLNFYANLLFRTRMHDFHCGLKAFDRKKVLDSGVKTPGFEFASEIIIRAKLKKLKMKEISTNLFKDGRDKKPHLRTFRDGFRHLFTITKIKFETSKPFRFLSTFMLLFAAVFAFTFTSCLIPHEAVHDNAITSVREMNEIFRDYSKYYKDAYRRFEQFGDIRNYAMIFLSDSNDPLASAIKMNYYADCDSIETCEKILELNSGNWEVISYNRYWQGQAATIHFFTPFITVRTAIYIFTLLFITLLCYTSYKLFKKDKILCSAYDLHYLCTSNINVI